MTVKKTEIGLDSIECFVLPSDDGSAKCAITNSIGFLAEIGYYAGSKLIGTTQVFVETPNWEDVEKYASPCCKDNKIVEELEQKYGKIGGAIRRLPGPQTKPIQLIRVMGNVGVLRRIPNHS